MGCIASYLAYLEEKRQEGMNLRIEKEQLVNKKRGEEVIKLLLLGAGESGKSTIFRQMKLLYGRSYDEENLRVLAHVVYANIISNLLVVLSNASLMGVQVRASDLAEEFLRTVNDEMVIDKALAEKVKQLWADPGVQQVWAQRSTFQVLDSLEYYMEDDNFARIGSDHYLPTFLDILHSRIRTSGIVEERYVIDGVQFTVFDVGGQRNERKKWIHSFSDVHAVIFVTAINEWVFEAICTNASEDPDANKNEVIEAATKHTLDKFLQVKRDTEKEIYHHVTCATDTKNIEVVFNASKDIILRANLVESGFMQ